ncbi:MAG: hypothetical protein GF317_12185 [Candidatus Lokiarchaeota archaeon]|nr:hypothetical protein [Candidatus Lokiarchaeota archaeon]MBD3200406.1 hypothetical protein [Candidatus Lokiarchaeota archaeon]
MEIEREIELKLLNHTDTTKVKVRFNDTDAMGVVHFMNYLMYFDDGFVSFMNSVGSSKRVEQSIYEGYALGVKHVDITYENSAKFGDFVIVKTNLERIGKKSMTFYHQICRESDDEVLAVVKATRFVLNLKTNKLMEILGFFKQYLSKKLKI